MFLHLLVLLLGRMELALGEGLPQGLLGHEGLQLQQSRHTAVLTDEGRTVRTEVDCRERNRFSPKAFSPTVREESMKAQSGG